MIIIAKQTTQDGSKFELNYIKYTPIAGFGWVLVFDENFKNIIN